MKIVEIEQLTKKFEKNIAVDNLDLTIEEGQIFGLLGPNGAGKSTTISVLCGLLKKNSGQIRLFGEDQEQHSLQIKQRIGLVPQEIALYMDLSAFENVRFFAGLYGLRGKELDAAATTALEFVGLADKAKDKPGTFSGGMKRRLNIACAIAHKPELIIMDEPTVGIDPQSRNYILKSIKKLNESGCTIIYTSHYMEEVEELCDYISIIDHGKVIAEGTKEQLVSLVSDIKEMRLIVDDVAKIDLDVVREISGIQAVEVIEGNTLKITSSSEVNNLNTVLGALISQSVEVIEMNQQTLNLETVFLNLTGRKLRD
ncbi:ABC transporter ATP-binding protein [Paenilisteria rocourtiae]|uniref:ABC-2 type transport system ATP-binding protein n=1 Tax=Listeria rocourtiae TaxID=647910 RepID=A0A4R6ZKF5_9LIST|nr:ABC transporter ATP-binding protein [Listeria rocourtiae]MBC1433724.1 ABC transporter ATP-binding protein [Listeria rocourtiae]MBC1604310.1 ABC transporter ATP-binding protein [Listeria rocourtiae]TDR52867.1 ABC-2 type transport system ATP-binding protein [Listeria rocourtiae]